MDLWRIGRLTEIGVDWLWFPRPFRAANAVPIRQSRANPMPIETPFWIGDFSSIRENRGQSCAMQTPIRCQSGLRPTARLLPIQCQSVPIHCQSGANPLPIRCESIANPLPIRCQPTQPILCQSGANPSPIECQSRANPSPIHCQSVANSMSATSTDPSSIECQSGTNPSTDRVPILCQSSANRVPI